MFRRSSNIAVSVPSEKVSEAVNHYIKLFGLKEKSRSEDSVELVGIDFTIWVDVAKETPQVLQEFSVRDGSEARAIIESTQSEITGESPCGFYVRDPYGLQFHVLVEPEGI